MGVTQTRKEGKKPKTAKGFELSSYIILCKFKYKASGDGSPEEPQARYAPGIMKLCVLSLGEFTAVCCLALCYIILGLSLLALKVSILPGQTHSS